MAPKPRKKKSAKDNAGPVVDKNWEPALCAAPFAEESWQACVSLVIGRSLEEDEFGKALSVAVKKPQRKLFSLLTWENTVAKIHEFGNTAGKMPEDAPMFHEVTENAKTLLDAKEEIPCELIAKLVKFQLLHIKTIDQSRRAAEKTGADGANDPPAEKKGAKDKKAKSAPPAEPSKEKKTTLKRRGDVEPPTFIDDEPEDGPQHYILILGFYQPTLPRALAAIGVHIDNIVKLCLEPTPMPEGCQESLSPDGSQQLRASPLLISASPSLLEVETHSSGPSEEERRLKRFWSDLRPVLDSEPVQSALHNMALLTYTITDQPLTSQTKKAEAVLALGSSIFNGVAHLLYDCLEWRKQHQHYLANVMFLSVPTVVCMDAAQSAQTPVPVTPGSEKMSVTKDGGYDPCEAVFSSLKESVLTLSVDVDMHYYCNLLDIVPPEAVSVPIILHCMLEQVVLSDQPEILPAQVAEEFCSSDESWLEYQLPSCVLEKFLPLAHTEKARINMMTTLVTPVKNAQNKERLEKRFSTEEQNQQPLVAPYHDERAQRLREAPAWKALDPVEVEKSMTMLFPVWQLLTSASVPKTMDQCRTTMKQQLQHIVTDDLLSWPEVELLFHHSIFESMPLTTVNQEGLIQQTPQQQMSVIIPWDDPSSFAMQHLHHQQTHGEAFLSMECVQSETSRKTCSLIELSEIQSYRQRSLCEWHYTEHHSATIFPQILLVAAEEYCCLDTFSGSNNNILYIFCHNPSSPHHQSQECWEVTLHTDLKFRKYLDHIAKVISEWTQEEETKKAALQIKPPSRPESPKGDKEQESRKEDAEEPVIRKDSLKAWKIEQDRLKEDELAKKSKKEGKQGPKKAAPASAKDTKKDKGKAVSASKGSKVETKSSPGSQPEPTAASGPPADEKEQDQEEEPNKPFIGYCMDGKVIHVSGSIQHLFPSDGGHVTVENISFVTGTSLLKICLAKDGHCFYTHVNHIMETQAKHPSDPHNEKNCDKVGATKGEESENINAVKHGSFSAVLDKGIHLSYSFYGPTGQTTGGSPQVCGGKVPETVDQPPLSSNSETPDKPMVCEEQPTLPLHPFNSLIVSIPNGLLLQFLRDSKGGSCEDQDMLVRQSFPLHGQGVEGQLKNSHLAKEVSRIITSQGTVVRHMKDKSIQVLFPDGTVSVWQESAPVGVSNRQAEAKSQQSQARAEESAKKKRDREKGCWITTAPSGSRICTVGPKHKNKSIYPLLSFEATDPITHQVMLNREDLLVSVKNPDGSQTTEHADGTRITSVFEDKWINIGLLNTGEQPTSFSARDNSGSICEERDAECQQQNSASVYEDSLNTTENNVEETMYTDEAGDESDQNDGEIGGECVKTKERVFLVEKEGCATVMVYPERHSAHVFLADGTVITADNRGAYQVFPSSVGILQIQTDGKCVYSTELSGTTNSKIDDPTGLPGTYTMSHTDKVACDVIDMDGNHFQVMNDGQVSKRGFSPAGSTVEHGEEELGVEDNQEMAEVNYKQVEHYPRLFLMNEDGSATELLRSQAVEELLYQAYTDPMTALHKEPLPDTKDEFGITILKPGHPNIWSQWLLRKQIPDITPPNLRNRTWHDFPRVENKTPGPTFGLDVGKGLSVMVRPSSSATQGPSVQNSPDILVKRELRQHRPLTLGMKNVVDMLLKEYIESLMEQQPRSEEMKVEDPCNVNEIAHSSDLFNLVLSLSDAEDGAYISDKWTADATGVIIPKAELPHIAESTAAADADSSLNQPNETMWPERLALYRQILCEDEACRDALKNRTIVQYFHPENEALYKGLPQFKNPTRRHVSVVLPSVLSSGKTPLSPQVAQLQKTAPRPQKPTPPIERPAAGTTVVPEKRYSTPAPPSESERTLSSSYQQYKSLHLDVTGKPRRTRVRLPNSILSSKPPSIPNQQFLTVEEPVRRKCRVISLTDPNLVVRGFQLLPPYVNFGTVQDGSTHVLTIAMKNVGVDTCRFHIKQPPPSTGICVFHSHGPVPAGLLVDLQVRLCLVLDRNEESGRDISTEITIHTETDFLYLPVTATVLPQQLFEIWHANNLSPLQKRSQRALQLSPSPSAELGIAPTFPGANPP